MKNYIIGFLIATLIMLIPCSWLYGELMKYQERERIEHKHKIEQMKAFG